MELNLIEKLVSEKSTPAFVFDSTILIDRAKEIKKQIGKADLCFAIKANPFLISVLDPYVDKYEVCSPGEFQICKHEQINMEKIVLSGVNKEYEDVKDAMTNGVGTYTVESFSQLELLQKCACEEGITARVLLRITSKNQFGINREDIENIISERKKFPNLIINGVQYYSGTQKTSSKIVAEIGDMFEIIKEIENRLSFKIGEFEYGPGFAIDYFKNSSNDMGSLIECSPLFNDISDHYKLTLEMGRFLTADCGEYITKVVDVKKNSDKNYCIVDGGINHVNYYGQVMGARIPPMKYYAADDNSYAPGTIYNKGESDEQLSICGSLCTTADVLARDILISDVKIGDVFVFEKVGAYSVTEGIYLFLSRKMPPIYIKDKNGLTMIRNFVESFEMNCASKE